MARRRRPCASSLQWAEPCATASATRDRATDELIASGPVFAAIPLARWLRNDSVVIDVTERYSRDPGYHDYDDPWFMYHAGQFLHASRR
jgi:hypothetical protein